MAEWTRRGCTRPWPRCAWTSSPCRRSTGVNCAAATWTWPRSPGARWGTESPRFAPAVVGVPGALFRAATLADLDTAEAHYGVALATRWPVRSWWLTWLPPAPVPAPVFVPGPRGGRVLLLQDEPRVVLAAIIESPIGPMTVATTHLSFVPGWNVRQLHRTQRALRQLPAPRFLLGDLNVPARLLRLVSGWRMLASRPTYPTTRPRVQFDHVLLDPQGAAGIPPAGRGETPALDISDHRPLIVELVG